LQREAERPDVERTKEENEELRTELKNMISTQTALMEQLNELKGEKETLEEQVTEVNEICDGLKLEITRLRARVVHSPEKIRNAIVELNAQITQTRQQLQDNEVKSRRLASRIELLDGLHQDVIACNRQMEECKEVVEEQEEAMQKLMQGREVVGQIESQINGLNVVKEQLEYKDSNTDLKISRLEGNQEKKREANGERLKKLQQERAQVLDQLEKIRQRVQEKKRYLDELNQKISTEKAKIQEEINQVQGQYDILRRQTFVYQDEINRLLMTFLEKLTEE
ncbi:kinetochore-associated Ndc80 complex subunit nuf2, partial [Spiromyces aspiralis]